MSSKGARLVKHLATLAASNSASDWKYAAESLEEIARVARAIAEFPDSARAPNRRVRNSAPKKKRTAGSKPKSSRIIEKFADYLTQQIGTASGPNLRDLANQLGMKSDLPKNSAAIAEMIRQHLAGLSERDRVEKIKGAVSFVERHSPVEDNHYDRWVSLITKK